MDKIKVLVVIGPTASGKTSLSVELAKKLNGEIVSADSMQIYKNMRIATAKPTEEEMQGIPHHMMNFLEPDKQYSVGQYVIDADKAIQHISAKGKLPIICGGTGLYVDSLLKGIDFAENSSDISLREELQNLGYKNGADYLLDILNEFDPDSAERLSVEKNIKRIARAIEFYKTTGITITEQNENNSNEEYKYDCLIIGLTAANRQIIYDRINRRVDVMMEEGLLDEAKEVISSDLSLTSSKAIGYKELLPYFEDKETLDFCIDRLKTETRHYAKRQLTWFRRNQRINWINIDNFKDSNEIVQYSLELIKNRGFLNG